LATWILRINYDIPLNYQGTRQTLIDAEKAGAIFAYGGFITVLINFSILAFVIFRMVRLLNKAKRTALPAAPTTFRHRKISHCREKSVTH